tara:strand:+ start:768 stop:959 length:192 start_codon:yes stop_codon:yes gene_type:complete
MYEYNYKVLVVLIDSGYIQDFVFQDNENEYPKFLVGILERSDRGLLKEACCRKVIKYFSKLGA